MPNRFFSEVTQQGFFSRLGGSIKSILFGLLIFIAAIPFLFWNEGRAVKEYKSLTEGEEVVQTIDPVNLPDQSVPALVHFTGLAYSEQTLKDVLFGIEAKGLRLKRQVEMYQWEEETETQTKTNTGGSQTKTTRYEYESRWSRRLIDSSAFRYAAEHTNPAVMPFSSESFSASDSRVGGMTIPQDLIRKVNASSTLNPQTADLPESTQPGQKYGEYLYYGLEPAQPQVGDVRIKFTLVPEQVVSVIAQLRSGELAPFNTKAGGVIYMLKPGEYSAVDLFQSAHQTNKVLTWVLRFVGFLLMFIGLSTVMKPLRVVADVLPIIGRLMGVGIGLVSGIIALFVSLSVIAVAWLVYRPFLAVALFLMAAGALYFIKRADQAHQTEQNKVAGSSMPPPPPPKSTWT